MRADAAAPSRAALVRAIVDLAWPVLIAQLAAIGMMVADTVILGRHSTDELAAVAVGASLYVSISLGLGGVVQALTPIIAQHRGAGRHQAIADELGQTLWLLAVLAMPGCWLLVHPGPVLALADLPSPLQARAESYLACLAWGLPGSLAYRAFSATANALGRPRPLMAIGIAQTAAHAFLASLLVGGVGGLLPPLGAVGAALSQVTVAWSACLAGIWLLARDPFYRPYAPFARFAPPVWRVLRGQLRLGVPMGVSYLVEITAFTCIALFVARLGPAVIGGHRIAANLSALVYMLPMSLAIATSALVGQAAGAGNEALARRTVGAGLLLSCGLSLVQGGAIWLLRWPIALASTPDPAVAAIAAGLVVYVALYQPFDAAQTIAAFALRGYKVSFLPLFVHLSCFWGLGLALGYWLAFLAPQPQGAAGFWQAAALSTVAAALLLGSLLHWVMRRRAAG
jgi:multidrug resistance protein, MATE family